MFFITNSKVYKASTSFLLYRLYSVCMQQKDKARNNYTPWLSIMNIKFIVDSLSYRNYSFYFIWVIQFYIKQVVFLPAFIIRKISITLDELGILIIHKQMMIRHDSSSTIQTCRFLLTHNFSHSLATSSILLMLIRFIDGPASFRKWFYLSERYGNLF